MPRVGCCALAAPAPWNPNCPKAKPEPRCEMLESAIVEEVKLDEIVFFFLQSKVEKRQGDQSIDLLHKAMLEPTQMKFKLRWYSTSVQ